MLLWPPFRECLLDSKLVNVHNLYDINILSQQVYSHHGHFICSTDCWEQLQSMTIGLR
jgi:hypothetical protein